MRRIEHFKAVLLSILTLTAVLTALGTASVGTAVQGPSPALDLFSASPDPSLEIVMYVDNGHSINNTPPPPIFWYVEGDHIPIIVAEELADGGRVVSAGVIYGLRGYYGLADYYWRRGEMDNLFDGIFQWLKPGATWVLWYEGDDVYYRNKISTSSDDEGCMAFADALRDDFGYTMDYSADSITSSLLAIYDILVLPQLQEMPSDDDINIIVNWVRGGGGLVILDESDYFVCSAEMNNAILDALGATHRFQHDQVNTNSYWNFYASVDASTEIGASYGAPTAYVASICSIRELKRTVSVTISPKIRSGMPGTTLFEYEIIVTNGWEYSDTFTLDVSDDAGWDLAIAPLETTIPGTGLDNTIRLTVTVPEGTPLGTVDDITVTVTSTTNSSIVDSDNCIARAAFVIYPTDDAYVPEDDPDGNYGGRYGLYVGRYGTAWQNAFMKFELSDIPADATIQEAGLYLWCYDTYAGTPVRVHPVDNDDWWEGVGTEGDVIEGAISWNDAPSFNNEVILDTKDVTIRHQVYHWDVTSFVADEYEGDELVSLALTPPPDCSESNNVSFDSKDWFVEGEHPYLAVYYTVPTYLVSVSISPYSQDGAPGDTLSYTVTVKNEGDTVESYDLGASDTEVWSLSLSQNTVTLDPDESTSVTLTVSIPGTAEAGTNDTVTVTATSQADPNVMGLNTCIARAEGPGAGVSVVSPNDQSGSSGATLTYTVTIVNEGDDEDTYDLTVTDTWGATISPTPLTIAAGGSGTATVSVTIPEGTASGTEDEITVEATSRTDSAVSDSDSFTAQATAEEEGLPMTLIAIVVVIVVVVVVVALVFLRGRKAAPSWGV
ncbi:MAG: hypothetical protein CEE41_03465 [Hadesarchaea archaeon B3_Hades]|nr:MAG: hypothetical protein CEE41_03465 [Hadesarchaea archaeon B3_Hades]